MCRVRLLAALGLLSGACSHPVAPPAAPVREVTPVAEIRSEGVVAIAAYQDAVYTLCSGALVAPNLVLTARHCIVSAKTASPSCDVAGRSHNGAHVERDLDPGQIAIYLGDKVKPGVDKPLARGVKSLYPDTKILCDADVAYVLLDHPIHRIPTLPVRMHAPVAEGDLVAPIGYGGGRLNAVGTKVTRSVSPVLARGPTLNRRTGAVLGSREFEVETATCKGDSGGPAIDVKTGEIVGVVSRGGSCSARGNHVYTSIAAFEKLTHRAFDASMQAARSNK
jgi:hypothetical protein